MFLSEISTKKILKEGIFLLHIFGTKKTNFLFFNLHFRHLEVVLATSNFKKNEFFVFFESSFDFFFNVPHSHNFMSIPCFDENLQKIRSGEIGRFVT